ncbi:MAG: Crp/Fnr family transcriptional regulator [Pseudonocardiaceae bacterium]
MGGTINNTGRHDNRNCEWGPDTFVGRLQPAERQALLALGGLTLHPEGEYLLVEGDRTRFVLVLHGGPVKVVVHDTSGREHLLGLRRRGDLLGELSYLDNQPRSASVVPLRPIYATKIHAEQLRRFLEEYSRVWIELTRCVGERLRDADRSRLELSSDDVALRVTRLLRKLAHGPVVGSTRRGAVIPITQGQLAQLAHAAEVTVHRVLREFKTRGMVHTAYRRIEVPCVICLDRLLAELSVERKDRNDIHGCGGCESHRSQ